MRAVPFVEIEMSPWQAKVAIAALRLSHSLSLGNVAVLADAARAGLIPAGRHFSYSRNRPEMPLGAWTQDEFERFEGVLQTIGTDLLAFPRLDGKVQALTMSSPVATASAHVVQTHEVLRVLHNVVAHHLSVPSFDADAGTSDATTATKVEILGSGNTDYRVRIVLTGEKSYRLTSALELYSRVGIGQLEFVGECVRDGSVCTSIGKISDRYAGDQFTVGHRVEDTLRGFKPVIGHPASGSWGISADIVSDDVKLAWETYKEIEKARSYYREPNPKFKGVNYDGNPFQYTREPLPGVRVLEATA